MATVDIIGRGNLSSVPSPSVPPWRGEVGLEALTLQSHGRCSEQQPPVPTLSRGLRASPHWCEPRQGLTEM